MCMAVDAEYDRLSEAMLDCIFLRCYTQYEGAETTMAVRDITSVPSWEVFYRGDLVAKLRGGSVKDVQKRLEQYGFVVSTTDLFGQSSYLAQPAAEGSAGSKSKDPWDAMADAAARSSRSAGGRNNPNAPVRTTMRYYPGGMGGLGQSAADNVRERGSTMDEWQAQRGKRGGEGGDGRAQDGTSDLRGVGQPLEEPGEFWKKRLQDQFEIFKERTTLEDLAKDTRAQGGPPSKTPWLDGPGPDAAGPPGKKKDDKDDDDVFKAIWND
jgi:hypothetical protein